VEERGNRVYFRMKIRLCWFTGFESILVYKIKYPF
jgi:hypothetical protein